MDDAMSMPMNAGTADRLGRIHTLLNELTSSPWSHDQVEFAMAVAASQSISQSDDTSPVWLLLAGVPSSDKTTNVQHLRSTEKILFVDNLTENALSSGYVPEKGQKRKPDLLERIEKEGITCLVIKDLTTLFSMRDDKVKKILGELQSIYDGRYSKFTGTVGDRTYKTRFSIVACITPSVLAQHHRYMAQMGSRFLIYRIPRLTEEERKAGMEMYRRGKDRNRAAGRKVTLTELQRLVAEHLSDVSRQPVEPIEETPEQEQQIEQLAELLAQGRTVVRWVEARGKWAMERVQTEEPFRAIQQLRTLAWALARIHGRKCLADHELELLRRVVLSSMPADRTDVLLLLPVHRDGLTVKACAEGTGKSPDRASQLLDELGMAGLLERRQGASEGGRPAQIYQPGTKISDLIIKPWEALNHLADPDSTFSDKTSHKDIPGNLYTQGGECYRKSPSDSENPHADRTLLTDPASNLTESTSSLTADLKAQFAQYEVDEDWIREVDEEAQSEEQMR